MSDTAGRNIPLLRGFYVANAANTMIMPVVVLYWLNHGLSMSEVLFLQGFFAVCVALLELPSGYFSDWFSRRVTLMLSGFFTALGLGIYLVATDFWSFLPAEVCFALGMSLLSGTLEAMAYESCPPATRATEGPRVLGALQERYFIMLAVYSVAGSAVAAWLGIEWTIALAAAVVLSSCVFAVCLVEPERVRARDL